MVGWFLRGHVTRGFSTRLFWIVLMVIASTVHSEPFDGPMAWPNDAIKISSSKKLRDPGSQTVVKGAVVDATSDPMANLIHFRMESVVYTGYSNVATAGSAYSLGTKFGFAPKYGIPFYVGPELSFSLFSPGSMMRAGGAAWFEIHRFPASAYQTLFGLGAGGAFPTAMPAFTTTTWTVYADLSVARPLDDLAALALTLRPALTGGFFSFNALFNIIFRFL